MMTKPSPSAKNDRRILSPREMLAKARDNTQVMRLRTVRDVLPGGHMAALTPVLVDWQASQIQAANPFVVLRNVNYGGNPIERTTIFHSVRMPLEKIRFAEFILVPLKHMGPRTPFQHVQLRFVFQPDCYPELLSLAGARTGADSRFPDLVLSWETWLPPHQKYNAVKGLDSSFYQLTLRAFAGPQRFLEETLRGKSWHAFRLQLPGGDAGRVELVKVLLALGDGVGRHTLSRMLKEGEEDWLAQAPRAAADSSSRRDWQMLKEHIHQPRDYGDSRMHTTSGDEYYHTMVHSCATLARYAILVATHRLVESGRTSGLDLDQLPEAVLGKPEAWMQDAAHAKLGGLFMRGPLAAAYALRHPHTRPDKIPGQLARAGLIEQRDGKLWRVHYTWGGTRPYEAAGIHAVDLGASEA